MGPGQKFLTQARSIFYCSGRVSHLWFWFEFGKFPLKTSNFQFFSLRVKKNLFESDQKVPRRGSLLFNEGQNKLRLSWVRAHLYSLYLSNWLITFSSILWKQLFLKRGNCSILNFLRRKDLCQLLIQHLSIHFMEDSAQSSFSSFSLISSIYCLKFFLSFPQYYVNNKLKNLDMQPYKE